MAKLDRRVRRTRRLLGEALLELIPEKGYDAITIRDIAERADVAYATFFRHFDSKESLLQHVMEGVIEELTALAGDEKENHFIAEGLVFFRHIAENQMLYQSLLSSRGSRQVALRMKEAISEHIRTAAEAHYFTIDTPAIPLEIVIQHIAASALELVAWWLAQGMPYSQEEMALIYDRLIIQGTWHIVPRGNVAKLPPGFHQSPKQT